MDEMVLRSMLKWPNVPAVYGWLRLDRRGQWLIRQPDPKKDAAAKAAPGGQGVAPRFERVVNPAMNEFIGRNYACDSEGRYFFQNGPQRVYVALEYTPWIYRFDSPAQEFVAHTGATAGPPKHAYIDDRGGVIVVCAPGPGVVLDRDLEALTEGFSDLAGTRIDFGELIEPLAAGHRVRVRLGGAELTVEGIRAQELPARFGFVPRPAPPEGRPDC
ncbi:MAG: hypothetical protein A3G25_17915 [Betaproteobacteria bacterium RIFCSPLOWO2_12_FULL_63_13]|nr:MAG: hypothetical protein A3G25_17915 [Betaproteobacteria bacterium RIFCSPLOWO2_12_FULL_63_13]